MLAEIDAFRQEFEIAAQHLAVLRQQLDLLPDRPGAPQRTLEGLAEAFLALKQAHDDLSRQNQACEARCQGLEAELAYYRDIFENAPHARLLTDLNGTIQAANTPASVLFRVSPDALTGEPLAVLLAEQTRETLAEHLAQLRAGGALYGWEVRLQTASGEAVAVSLDAVPVHGLEHRLVALQWQVRDIGRQKQAEDALLESEHLLRSFLEQSLDGIALTDEHGQVIEWNRALEQSTGLPATETVGRPIWDLQLQLDGAPNPAEGRREQVKNRFIDLLSSGQAPWLGQPLERAYVRPDGARRVVQGVVFPFQTRKGFLLASISRDVTDLKRVEDALRQSESKYRMLVDSLQEGIWLIDKDAFTTFANPRMAVMLGCTVDEMIGAHLFSFIDDKELELARDSMERCQQGIREKADLEFRRKDGTLLYANLEVTPLFDADGRYTGALAGVADMTERRRLEQERERLLAQALEDRRHIAAISAQAGRQADELGAILNAIPDPVAVWDARGAVLRANPAAAALGIGTAQTGMAEVAAQLAVRHADGRPISVAELPVARALHGEVIRNEAEILVSPDGEEHEILVSAAPVFSGDEIVACVVVSHDITDKRRAEKAREQLLVENRTQREFLERLVEAAPVGIAVLRGPEHRYELANPYYLAMTGAPDRPIIGRTIVEAIPDLPARGMPPLMDRVYRTGRTVSTREVRLSTGPGREETYWNTDRVPLHDPDGAVEGILVLARDVTREVQDRRRIEALSLEAQRQAAELAAILDALIEPVIVYDTAGMILRANPAAVESLGLDPVGLLLAVLSRRVSARYPDSRPIPDDCLAAFRALHGETVRNEVEMIFGAHDEEHAIVTSAAPIVTGSGISGAVVAWHDITHLKRAVEALQATKLQVEAEKRHLAAILQALPVGVVITDAQGGVLLTNGMDEQIWGARPSTHSVDDYVQYQAWWADSGRSVEPHEWASAQAVLEGKPVYGQVLEIQRFDGKRGFIVNSAVPIRDEEGRVTGSAVAVQDITALRCAEQALRESEERFRTVIENSRDGINMLDLETGRYVFMSPAQVKLTGFSAEEMGDISAEEAFERVHPDDREKSFTQQKEIAAGQSEGSTAEYRWKVKSGEYRWFSDSRKVVRDKQGRAVALVGVSRDITDQKQAEEALQASEEKYRLLFQNMEEGFALYELLYDEQGEPADWRVLEVNDAYTRHTGVARDRIVGRRISELFSAAIPEFLPRFAQVVATETPSNFETYAKAVNGYLRISTFPAGGHRFASTIEDITNRKRAEEALRASEERFATMFRYSPDGIGMISVGNGTFLDVNEAFTKMLGCSRSEVLGHTWKELNVVTETDAGDKISELFLETGQLADYEFSLTTRQGKVITLLVSLVPITVSGESCILAIGRDITKRKESEDALRRMQAELTLGIQERAVLEERQRLARELHDSVSQALYGVSLGINTAFALLDSDRTKVLEALNYALSLTHVGLTEVRALIFELRPESLAQEGLVVALAKLVEASRARYGFEVDLGLCDEPAVPLVIKEALYRIAQEALHNAVKHANPSRLDVRLICASDSLVLEVCDNGAGFDPLTSYPGHLGLRSMRERAIGMGGSLAIDSAPDCGTQIRVRIPLAVPETA